MDNLIRSKNFLALFLFLSFANSSHAVLIEHTIREHEIKKYLSTCEKLFMNNNIIRKQFINNIKSVDPNRLIVKEQFISEEDIDPIIGEEDIDQNKIRTGEEHIRSLIMPLDWITEKLGGMKAYQRWFHQHPILLRDLLKFREELESLLKQKPSRSDSLHMQDKLERMVLPWVFWRPKSIERDAFVKHSEKAITGEEVFTLIKNPEKTLKKSLQEWGEFNLGRSLTEQEVQALEKAFNYEAERDTMVEVQYFIKQKILEEAGFSKKELDLLGRKTVLRGSETVSIEIPQRTSEEARLKAKGYNSAYTRGMDEILELIAVGKQLLKQNINPYTTHVPYFAKKLREYIAYMEKGISNPTQREEFDLLKQYVELLIKEEGVTYEQFIMVSLRLPNMLSTRNPNLINNTAQELVYDFPETFAFPTTVGILGIIALNTIRSENFESIGLVNRQTAYDGAEKGEPVFLSYHDIIHIKANKDGTHKGFYDKIKEKREHWPVEKGKNVELAYHILTHETPTIRSNAFVDDPKLSQYVEFTLRYIKRDVISKEVIDLSTDRDQKVQAVLDDLEQAFNEIRNEIMREHMPSIDKLNHYTSP